MSDSVGTFSQLGTEATTTHQATIKCGRMGNTLYEPEQACITQNDCLINFQGKRTSQNRYFGIKIESI